MASQEPIKTERLQAELVIIGGGGAGLSAALAAAENGCTSIIVLEKMGSPGGATAMSHDLFAAESPAQKRAGVDARKDDLFKIAMEWAHWSKINPRLVRAVIDKSGDTVRWLEEKGMKFKVAQFFYNQMPLVRHAMLDGKGARMMKILREKCEASGITILTHTRARKILRGEKGNITGVVAETKDGEITVTAKSVIVSTGGYGNNKEMLKKYSPYYHDTMSYDGVRGNTGDGITMGIEAGAAMEGLGTLVLHGPFLFGQSSIFVRVDAKGPDGAPIRVNLGLLVYEPYTLWVNKKGRRFMDEGHNLCMFAPGNSLALQPDGLSYTLFDSKTLQMMEEQGLFRVGNNGGVGEGLGVPAATPIPGLARELQKVNEKDRFKVSDSWDEIANWIGAEPKVLKATIDEYNASCDCGHDSLFVKDQRYLLPLQNPPYYAIRGQGYICEALGGIKINENMEALDTEDKPIPGLYAAGATTGCWESESYCYHLCGHLVGFALNSGRIAGENAAAYLSR